jgi:hypothetical protein
VLVVRRSACGAARFERDKDVRTGRGTSVQDPPGWSRSPALGLTGGAAWLVPDAGQVEYVTPPAS